MAIMKSSVFAGALETGVYRFASEEGIWLPVRDGLPDGLEVLSIVGRPEDDRILYMGTQKGLFCSVDGGDSWNDMGLRVEGSAVYSILLDPGNPATIYAGLDHTTICKTVDGGGTWRRLPTIQPEAAITGCFPVRVLQMGLDPNAPNEIYGALEVGGFIRSLDGGETWDDRSGNLAAFAVQPHLKSMILSDKDTEGMLDLHALVVSPTHSGMVWIANRMGLFVSEDRGDNWREFGIGRFSDLTYARDIMVSPHDPKVYLAALSESSRGHAGSLYRSGDSGETWQRIDHGISVDSTVMKVSVSSCEPDRIFFGARLGQVFGTEDGGDSWMAMPLPPDVVDVRAIYCI